tara:strand:+ start:1194 stop:1370 length:177 start_codon:yes stop_codon:yes gene_type:complete
MVMKTALLIILKSLLTKLLTEKVVGALIIMLLDYIASKTTNKVDDQLVVTVKDALGYE